MTQREVLKVGKTGDKYEASINDTKVSGQIVIYSGEVYLLSNCSSANGNKPRTMLPGYKYSWVWSPEVNKRTFKLIGSSTTKVDTELEKAKALVAKLEKDKATELARIKAEEEAKKLPKELMGYEIKLRKSGNVAIGCQVFTKEQIKGFAKVYSALYENDLYGYARLTRKQCKDIFEACEKLTKILK